MEIGLRTPPDLTAPAVTAGFSGQVQNYMDNSQGPDQVVTGQGLDRCAARDSTPEPADWRSAGYQRGCQSGYLSWPAVRPDWICRWNAM
ncbi:hypothetical protein GCM10027280_54240 [Micromonospora polyrhachis]